MKLIRISPDFGLDSLSTPQMLQATGIWEGPRGWDDLQMMPRYFPGRNILIKTKVVIDHDLANYMSYDQTGESFVTHRATLIGMDTATNTFQVEVDGKEDGPISVPVAETLELNQAHVFAHDVKGDLVLEDSLIFATKGKSEKAKLIEMAFKLAPLM